MKFDQLHRREFITLLGGAAIARPLSARAQRAGKIHKIGYLSPDSPSAVITPFFDALRELGWIEGQNVTFEYRYAGRKPQNARRGPLETRASRNH